MQSTSGPGSSRRTAVLIAAAIVLALVGIGGIASGVADNDDADKVASTKGTTSTTDDDGTSTGDTSNVTDPGTSTTVAGSTGTTAKGGTTGTTAAPGPGTTIVTAACPVAPAASADPAGSASPPALGTYTYTSCSDASDSQDSKVTAGSSDGGLTRRNVTSNAAGYPQTAVISYGPSGVLLESITINSPQGKITCDWKPDVQNYPAALKLGTTWSANSSCDLKQESGASPGKLMIEATGKITGKVAVNIGGTTVNAWVVESNIKLTTNVAFGSTTVNVSSLNHYDPAHGIDVFRHSQTQSEQGTITRDERLVSLTPKN